MCAAVAHILHTGATRANVDRPRSPCRSGPSNTGSSSPSSSSSTMTMTTTRIRDRGWRRRGRRARARKGQEPTYKRDRERESEREKREPPAWPRNYVCTSLRPRGLRGWLRFLPVCAATTVYYASSLSVRVRLSCLFIFFPLLASLLAVPSLPPSPPSLSSPSVSLFLSRLAAAPPSGVVGGKYSDLGVQVCVKASRERTVT